MRAKLASLLVGGFAAALTLAGCSDEEPGVPDQSGNPPMVPPSSTASGAPVETLPHSGAPKVENPIADTSQWEGDPCNLLTAQQLGSIGLKVPDPQREDVPSTGPGCYWEFDADSASGFSVSFASQGTGKGLSNLYKHKELGTAKVFEELPAIEGHPALIFIVDEDRRSEGECSVAVGLRDDLTVGVDLTADPSTAQGKEPCEWAEKVARLAVQTMKGAS